NQVFSKLWPGQKGWATFPTLLPDSGDVSHHPFKGQVRHFVDCILEDRESEASLDNTAQAHEICFASEISAREKRPVGLPLYGARSESGLLADGHVALRHPQSMKMGLGSGRRPN